MKHIDKKRFWDNKILGWEKDKYSIPKSKLGKLQKLHFDKAKKYIEYLMLGAERFKDIDAQRRLSWLESNYERFPDFVKFINDKTSKENAENMQRKGTIDSL